MGLLREGWVSCCSAGDGEGRCTHTIGESATSDWVCLSQCGCAGAGGELSDGVHDDGGWEWGWRDEAWLVMMFLG